MLVSRLDDTLELKWMILDDDSRLADWPIVNGS